MAADRLIGGCQAVVFGFVISRKNPDLPPVLHADLGRSNDMPGRVKAEFYPPNMYRFLPVHTADFNVPQPVPDDGNIFFMSDIPAMTPSAVIGMSM
jgi:hypothetical protein